jgi:membrane protein
LIESERVGRAAGFLAELRTEIQRDHTGMIAGSLAYRAMLAIFPAAIAAVSIYGIALRGNEAELTRQINELTQVLPAEAATLIGDQLKEIVAAPGSGLGFGAVIGIAAALWTASGGTKSLIKGLNIAYDVEEQRPFLVQRAIAYGLTVGLIVFVVGAVALVTFLPDWLGDLGMGDTAATLLEYLRWPGIFLIVVLGLGLLYKVGPNRSASRSKWLSPGAMLAAVLWVVATLGFSFYTSTLGDFNATYGALGSVVVLLLWFFISGFVILLGAEVNDVAEKRRSSPTGKAVRAAD